MKRKQKTDQVQCPQCGAGVMVMRSGAGARAAPFINYTPAARTPKSQEEIDAVDIPLQHALHIGMPVGLSVCVLCVIDQVPPEVRALSWGLVAGSAVFVLVRGFAAIKNWDHLGWRLEQMFKIDLNRDRVIGEPEKRADPPPTKAPDVIVKSGVTGNTRIKSTIPFTDYKEARNVARALLVWGVPFSRRKLTDTNAVPDDPDHYSAIYQAMVKAKLIKKSKGKNVLTDAGEQYLRKCLTPLPGAQ